jgi:hypothetical protein
MIKAGQWNKNKKEVSGECSSTTDFAIHAREGRLERRTILHTKQRQ